MHDDGAFLHCCQEIPLGTVSRRNRIQRFVEASLCAQEPAAGDIPQAQQIAKGGDGSECSTIRREEHSHDVRGVVGLDDSEQPSAIDTPQHYIPVVHTTARREYFAVGTERDGPDIRSVPGYGQVRCPGRLPVEERHDALRSREYKFWLRRRKAERDVVLGRGAGPGRLALFDAAQEGAAAIAECQVATVGTEQQRRFGRGRDQNLVADSTVFREANENAFADSCGNEVAVGANRDIRRHSGPREFYGSRFSVGQVPSMHLPVAVRGENSLAIC